MVKIFNNWFNTPPPHMPYEQQPTMDQNECWSIIPGDCIISKIMAWWLGFTISLYMIYSILVAVLVILAIRYIGGFFYSWYWQSTGFQTGNPTIQINNHVGNSNTQNPLAQTSAPVLTPAQAPVPTPPPAQAPGSALPPMTPYVPPQAQAANHNQNASSWQYQTPPMYDNSKDLADYLDQINTFFRLTRTTTNKAESLLYFLGKEIKDKLIGSAIYGTDEQQYQQIIAILLRKLKPAEKTLEMLQDEFLTLKQVRGERSESYHFRLTAAAHRAYPDNTTSSQSRQLTINKQFLKTLIDQEANRRFKYAYLT